jgi:hypothetical protein
MEGRARTGFNTNDSCSWNITHYTESAAVLNLSPERWGYLLVEGER